MEESPVRMFGNQQDAGARGLQGLVGVGAGAEGGGEEGGRGQKRCGNLRLRRSTVVESMKKKDLHGKAQAQTGDKNPGFVSGDTRRKGAKKTGAACRPLFQVRAERTQQGCGP